MLRLLRLFILRGGTIGVIRDQYGYALALGDGKDSYFFYEATEAVLSQGGNKFDAASKFMAMIVILAQEGGISDPKIPEAPLVTLTLLPKMVFPDRARADWDIAVPLGKAS